MSDSSFNIHEQPSSLLRLPGVFLLFPSLILSTLVIGYPIFDVIRMSVSDVNRYGHVRGFNGIANFLKVFSDPVFQQATYQTVIWTLCVVGGTMLVSIPIAIILNGNFYGRALARTILLLPWAVSLAMTAVVWKFVVNGDFGMLNHTLHTLGILDSKVPWLAHSTAAFTIEIFIGILVSMPFTVTILMGGLTAIPDSLYEASSLDGASHWQKFTNVTMPLLRPFLQISVVLNVIYVFNSFPIIWIMTRGGPANNTDILITYVYKQAFAFGRIGNAAAGSVMMFSILFVFSLVFLFLTRNSENNT